MPSSSPRLLRVAALLLATLLGACSEQPPAQAPAAVSFVATMPQGLSAAEVTRVSVRVSGAGIAAPLAYELARSGDTWRGTLADIPAGSGRYFDVSAVGADDAVLYQGHAGPVAVEGAGSSPAIVAVVMQQKNGPPAFANTAPVIDSLTVSRAEVLPGGTLELGASAHDVDNGDSVSFAWSASGGSFGAPTNAATSWTAPTAQGTYRITLTVTDRRHTSATLAVDIRVAVSAGTGSAEITVVANSWPSVSTMNALPSRAVVAQAVRLSAGASDPDGDALQYSWSSSCAGTFADAGSASPGFTLAALPSSGRCAFTVTVADGRGGSGTGTLTLLAGEGPRVDFAPQLDGFYKSAEAVHAGESVTLRLSAHDPEGTALRFSWRAAEGTLSAPTTSGGTSEVQWMAPACFDAPQTIIATVVDAGGLATSQAFEVAALGTDNCSDSTVRGRRARYFAQVDGTVIRQAQDLRTAVLGAWVPRADGTGFDYRSGEGREDGTFVVYGVERTPYFLQLDASYFQLDGRTVDLSYPGLGRPDVEAAPEGTALNLAFTGLQPWTFSDDLQLSVPNAGVGYFTLPCSNFALPETEGGTSLSGSFDYGQLPCGTGPAPLLDPSKGDAAYAVHLSARAVAGGKVSLQEAQRAAQLPAPLLASGAYSLSGELQPLPLQSVALDVRNAELDAFAAAAHPAAQLLQPLGSFGIGVSPATEGFGLPGAWPDLALGLVLETGVPDFVETAQFGNPYPAGWVPFAQASSSSSIRITLPRPEGGTVGRTIYLATSVMEQLPTPLPTSVTVRAPLSPPRNLTLDGVPATTALTGVGTSPVLAWDAPATGTPTRYTVRIQRFTVAPNTGFIARTVVAQLYTSARSVRIPPGLLRAGDTHLFIVTAEQSPGHTAQSPLRGSITSAFAQAVTSPVVP